MTPRERADQSPTSSFERYLQDKGKGRGGDGGNYLDSARESPPFTAGVNRVSPVRQSTRFCETKRREVSRGRSWFPVLRWL
ncbi:hypothetical protein GRX66_00395 [Halobacterium sp. PCN9]|uniref:Uncharacterized protein n=1 Tax=Halobacterium bonnevillei TaxID=2692200 RepID=A0A6B0SGT9_9EURY|nr:hypothetical protein [Halobacterium bonnevillei]